MQPSCRHCKPRQGSLMAAKGKQGNATGIPEGNEGAKITSAGFRMYAKQYPATTQLTTPLPLKCQCHQPEKMRLRKESLCGRDEALLTCTP